MTFNELADLLMAHPGVSDGFCQQTRGLEEFNAAKNGGGGWDKGVHRVNEYRVRLCTDKECADFTSKSFADAARQALEKLGLSVPDELKPLEGANS